MTPGTLDSSGKATILAVILSVSFSLQASAGESNWPQFRGPAGMGVATSQQSKPPVRWSEQQNATWKTKLPGNGWSSPVIWNDQIWLTTSRNEGREVFAICVETSGKLTHQVKLFDIAKPEVKNALNSYASPSPTIEAGRVYVHFGTYGTACLETTSGRVLWKRDDLNLDHQEGPGSSIVLHDDLLLFHCDGRDVQFVVALDKKTGKTAWKTKRSIDLSKVNDYQRKAFSTPLVVNFQGRDQMISPAAQGCYSYDPRTGKELWKVRYRGFSAVPRPVTQNNLAYVVTDFGKPELWAIRLDGRGDITNSHVQWKYTSGVCSTPSVVLVNNLIYFVTDKTGVASCVDAKTGQLVWKQRLGGKFSTSPLAVNGKIYFFDRDGKTTVIAQGREFRQLAVNKLDSGCMASPALIGDTLYLRTATALYRLEEKASQ